MLWWRKLKERVFQGYSGAKETKWGCSKIQHFFGPDLKSDKEKVLMKMPNSLTDAVSGFWYSHTLSHSEKFAAQDD